MVGKTNHFNNKNIHFDLSKNNKRLNKKFLWGIQNILFFILNSVPPFKNVKCLNTWDQILIFNMKS